jgi:crossover junction endodeoxyribonuclease RuvC
MKRNRRVLGLDPGLARMGWAIIEQVNAKPMLVGCGCLETSPDDTTDQRLYALHNRLKSIVTEYQPTMLAVEKLFFSKNVTTAMAVSQARGIALLAAAETHLPVVELTPTTIKQSITGDGRADKRQMGKMVQLLLGLTQLPKHDDTTDAIAIALCGISTKVVH